MIEMEENRNEHYDASDIQVLEGLEAVRKRPGMYIGTTDVKGLHHLVWEIVDNAIDESLAGFCNNIEVVINKDNSITVKDDGRGIPVDIHPKTKISTVETVYTVLHAGGKFGGGGYKVSGGLHGVGASVVNALSKWVTVTVYKGGKVYEAKFEDGGKTVQKLTVIGECSENRTGTTVSFKPDPEIFDTDIYDYETLKTRTRELAFLNKGLRLTLRDDRDEEDTQGEIFLYEGGISEYVRFINQGKTPLHDKIIHLNGEKNGVWFEVALQYNNGYSDNIYSFVNNINTHDGGTHEDGVKRALVRTINAYARKNNILKDKDENLKAAVIESCINGTMTVKVAAERLNFSERYVKKLKARYKKYGASSMMHGNCGKQRLIIDVKKDLHQVNYYKSMVLLISSFMEMIKNTVCMVLLMMQHIKLQDYICVKMNVCMDI